MSIENFVRSSNLKNVVLVAINDVQESLLKLFYRNKYKIIKYELRIDWRMIEINGRFFGGNRLFMLRKKMKPATGGNSYRVFWWN